MPRESVAQAAIIKRIMALGGWAIVTQPPGVPTGTPDILACLDGRFLAVEVKRAAVAATAKKRARPATTASPLQSYVLGKIAASGGVAIVATSADDFEDQWQTINS